MLDLREAQKGSESKGKSPKEWRQRLSRSLSRRSSSKQQPGCPSGSCKHIKSTGELIELSNSPLLNLPGEVRNLIYSYAFQRYTEEILQFLQFGPPTNDASGLLLTCRQTRMECQQLAHDAAVTVFPASVTRDQSGFSHSVLPRPWRQTWKNAPECRLDKTAVKSLALQTTLFRHPNSLEDLLHGCPLTGTTYTPEVFFLQVCLCNAIHWLHDHPDFVMPFCIAIERLAMAHRTLKRIVIYYCGKEWPSWVHKSGEIDFPNIVYGRHLIRGYSGANWNLRAIDKPLEGNCRKRCELSWNYFQAHPGESADPNPVLHHDITIDYYDSFSVSGVGCVGVRPAAADAKDVVNLPMATKGAKSRRASRLSSLFKGLYIHGDGRVVSEDTDKRTPNERHGNTDGASGYGW
ncbi:hypothetical protein EJ08DRAFT_650606 [Tothia fuscella]|uniref:Uncharacterized protein n=1 Tax=Tothia fuscella TaxID=1048955 RepID=A0A9P4NPC2_9PEZI|nr:hypothetical protein EJ08DRAFT_650606 [Tothia fuscella]